ncbi:ABC transporter permease subunit [Bryobacter aggregatus]|uniref:ABC transporter permease subunit n=1 Tax=Bryobacter aggregatus TaxID=360054 RepID=UPI0004E1E80B|nr:ABC transporter permease subunit [Bryobacter aggregatus]
MDYALWRRQIFAIVQLEWKKTLFSRRGIWVYALAFLPALLFGINAYRVKLVRAEQERVQIAVPNAGAASARIAMGMKTQAVADLLRDAEVTYSRFSRGRRLEIIRYSDGANSYDLIFREGELSNKRRRNQGLLSDDILAFAGVYQYFFLRLAIFFGCVGIFMNLFRGEMLDQSLHYYLLAPVRREVLMVGKYLAGLLATALIFVSSTALQLYLMLSAHSSKEMSDYLANGGSAHILQYMGVTALGCVGYGSIFLAAGLVMKNPMIAAATILFWESINWFLPAMLKKFSVIFYLQSLCPIVAPLNSDIPDALKILVSTAAPTPGPLAVAGLFAVSIAVLGIASIYARKIEINYGAD